MTNETQIPASETGMPADDGVRLSIDTIKAVQQAQRQADDTVKLLHCHLAEIAEGMSRLASLLEALGPLNEAACDGDGQLSGIQRRAANARAALTEELIARAWKLQEMAEYGAKDRVT